MLWLHVSKVMVGILEEDKQACCKSIKVLSRALPDVGPSACLALLALDKKALHVPAWLTDMRNTQYRPDMAATTLLPHNYQTEKVQSRQHCHHLHLPSSTIFSPAPCQHLNLNLIPSALTGTVCCLDLSPPLERPDHTIPALEAPCFN
ncbi:uncharacterized [Tachysurus ichikawai]